MKSRLPSWVAYLWLAAGALALLSLGGAIWLVASEGLPLDQLSLMAIPPEEARAAMAPVGQPAGVFHGYLVNVRVPATVGMLGQIGHFIWPAAGAAIAWLMYGLFRDLGSDGLFLPRNARRLTATAWLMIGAELVRIAATLAQDIYVRRTLDGGGWRFATFNERDVTILFAGLVLLALAYAFRVAEAMREDARLTV